MSSNTLSFLKCAQRLAEFCQSGEISPNLVALVRIRVSIREWERGMERETERKNSDGSKSFSTGIQFQFGHVIDKMPTNERVSETAFHFFCFGAKMCFSSGVTRKNRQMSIKVAQK